MRPFRILVASHGDLARALLSSAQLICGRADDVGAIGLHPDESPESFGERLRTELGDDPRAVLVLTDLYGGTPHNVAAVVTRGARAFCISGVNLGLVIEAITTTDELDEALVARFVALARDGVVPSATTTPMEPTWR